MFRSRPEFLQARLDKGTYTCRTTGKDSRLKVRIGPPGQGSYIDLTTSEVTIDVLDVIDEYKKFIFVCGHEGAHRRQTPRKHELAALFTATEIKKLYSELGFQSTQNILEDCAINDGMVCEYPGMEVTAKAAYGGMQEGQGLLNTPEIKNWHQRNGSVPKFSVALAAPLIRLGTV